MNRKTYNRFNTDEKNPYLTLLKPKVESCNIFQQLREQKSILLTLYDNSSHEVVNYCGTAPSPSKDYCQLLLTFDHVIFRWWRITLRNDGDKFHPGEIKDSFEEYVDDENIQRHILASFGNEFLSYITNIVANGKVDYLARMPEAILLQIISHLSLEDVSRLAQTNKQFRELCRSDRVWIVLYERYYSKEITKELQSLAQKKGWRSIFFTNKIKLQVELRREKTMDDDNRYGSLVITTNQNTYQKPQSAIRRRSLISSLSLKSLDVEVIAFDDNQNSLNTDNALKPKPKSFLE